jgi:tripartite ATP-independent transporter DctM subunit
MMDPLIMGLLGLSAIFVLVVLGMRIAFATALVGFVGLWIMKNMVVAGKVVGFLPHAIVAHYSLSVIPLFIIMGYYAFYAGLTDDIFFTARQWVGHLPGGLAVASVVGCAGFAACTGASTASAAIMGRVAIPEMRKYGYHPRLAAGVVAASGTLASLIPPSVILVIYGIITEQSIGALLIGGFIPGVISAAIYAAMIYTRVKISPELGELQPRVSWKKRFYALKGTWGVLLLIFLIIGGIYSGVFTPTEAGGAGAFSAFLMALFMRRLTLERLKESLLETGRTTIMIFSIIVGVLIFVRFLALTGLPATFSQFVLDLPLPRLIVILLIMSIYVFLGMFLDAIGMMMLTLPIVFPAVVALGYDPIWFGIIIVKMCEICLITPPVGLNCYIVRSVAPDIPLEEIFRGIIPFVAMDVLTVALFIAFPDIITFLPSRMLG